MHSARRLHRDLPARSRADAVYEQLKRDIAEFKLVPGDRFSENETSERLGVSRTPVRQALTRLQQEGYVEVLFRSGWRVLPFDFAQFEQLYDLRMILETTAAHRICEDSGRVAWILCEHFPEHREEAFDQAYRHGAFGGYDAVTAHPAYADYLRRRKQKSKSDNNCKQSIPMPSPP